MASKKKKLTPLQKEYNKQYKAYIKRIESAREAGFLIPEEHVKIKKEKPRTRDIEALKKVTRKSLQQEVKQNKLGYVNPFTGEILTGGRAVDISRQRRPRYTEPERPNYERPTTFDEAVYIKDRINEYFETYNVPESNKDWMAERLMETHLKTIRGSDLDFKEWKKQEKRNGWLFKDPNRPLEREEIDYIQSKIDADLDLGQEPVVGEYIDDLRGWKPEYNYVDKYYENEKKSGNNPVDLFDLRPEQTLQEIGSTWDRNERPETIDRPETNIAESPIETIAIDNLRERISNVELSGESYKSRIHEQSTRDRIFRQMAESNKTILERKLDELIEKYGPSYVDEAIRKANASGRAFQEYFLYRGSIMGQYLTDIEHFLLNKDYYYAEADELENEYEGW